LQKLLSEKVIEEACRLVSELFTEARKQGRKFLLEPEAKAVCMKYGIPVTKFGIARTVEEAVELAEEMGYPVVLKVVSPDVVHKFDVGGVVLNLKSREEVREAFKQILENVKKRVPNAKVLGVTVQEMAAPSTEVIVGAVKDPQFGPALMFGLGGIFVEVLKDVTFRIAPITEERPYHRGRCKRNDHRNKGLPASKRLSGDTASRHRSHSSYPRQHLTPSDGSSRNQRARPKPRNSVRERSQNSRRQNNTCELSSRRQKMLKCEETFHSRETLKPFFNPNSVAVIGASAKTGAIGYVIFKNFLNPSFRGKAYPVNPKYDYVQKVKCYPSVREIPDQVDLAVVAIPAPAVPKVIRECAEKGVKAAVIISGGFSETGPEGAEREEQLKRTVEETGIRIIGPNCLGVYDATTGVDTVFLPDIKCSRPPNGNIAFTTQSGAFGGAVLDWLSTEKIGLSK